MMIVTNQYDKIYKKIEGERFKKLYKKTQEYKVAKLFKKQNKVCFNIL